MRKDYDTVRSRITTRCMQGLRHGTRFTCKDYEHYEHYEDYGEDYTQDYEDYEYYKPRKPCKPRNPECNPHYNPA